MLKDLPWRAIGIAFATVVTLLAIHHTGVETGRAEVQAEWDAERLAQVADVQMATEKVLQAERQTAITINRIREDADAKVEHIARRHAAAAALAERLRDEAADDRLRALRSPATTQLANCPEAGLADGDGELDVPDVERDRKWLLQYAADAAVLQVALDACRQQYNAGGTLNAD
jgi:hypothetical protein